MGPGKFSFHRKLALEEAFITKGRRILSLVRSVPKPSRHGISNPANTMREKLMSKAEALEAELSTLRKEIRLLNSMPPQPRWTICHSVPYGTRYYYNESTGETQWETPEGVDRSQEPAHGANSSVVPTTSVRSTAPLYWHDCLRPYAKNSLVFYN